jgi:sugar lactone lactonase YvrE
MGQLKVGEFEKLEAGIYLEGLGVDHKRNIVWFSDPLAGGIFARMPDGKVRDFNLKRRWTGGIMVNEDGAALSSGPGGIMWNNPETGKSGWLIDKIDGKPINGINEMVPDGTGGIYFGTNDIEMIETGGTFRPTNLYRLTVDRKLILLAEGIGFTNGIALTPDRKHFYCSSTFECVWAFDVNPDLTLTNKRKINDRGDADGMAMDTEGNIWITGFGSADIMRLRPDGTVLSPIKSPDGPITQVRFGGADGRDYYVNTVPAGAGLDLKDGKPLTEKKSFLFRGRSEVPGVLIEPTRFKLD